MHFKVYFARINKAMATTWYECNTDRCNTENNLCNECKLDKQLDVCTGDYFKPSQKNGESKEDGETGTNESKEDSNAVTEDNEEDETNESKDSKEDEKDVSEDSEDVHKNGASEASNQLIKHPWSFIFLLSFVFNVINRILCH